MPDDEDAPIAPHQSNGPALLIHAAGPLEPTRWQAFWSSYIGRLAVVNGTTPEMLPGKFRIRRENSCLSGGPGNEAPLLALERS